MSSPPLTSLPCARRQQWSEPDVPPGLAEGPQEMDTLHTFAPNMDGWEACERPAARSRARTRTITTLWPTASGHRCGARAESRCLSRCCRARRAVRSARSLGCPVTCQRSFSAACRSATRTTPWIARPFHKNRDLVHELGDRMHAAAQKREGAAAASGAAVGGEAAQAVTKAASAAGPSAQKATHATALVDAQSMSQRYQSELEDGQASVRTKLRRCTCGHGSRSTRSKPGQPRSFSFSAMTVRRSWTGRALWVSDTSSSASCPRTRRTSSCQAAAKEHRRTHAGTFQSSRQCSRTLCAKGPYSPQRSKCGRTARAKGASISRPGAKRNWRTSSC